MDVHSGTGHTACSSETIQSKATIAKLKSCRISDLFTSLSLQSREFISLLYPTMKSSFVYPQSSKSLRIKKIEMVNNQILHKEFIEKKHDMKEDGRSDKELKEYFAYIHSTSLDEVEEICENGLEIGNKEFATLGKASMGIYVCKHADLITPNPLVFGDTGFIIILKIIKGKAKVVGECRAPTTSQEPTPPFDCYVTKLSSDVMKSDHLRAYKALQYYLYEYGELELVNRPRQILPFAVLHYSYVDEHSTLPLPRGDSNPSQMETGQLEADIGRCSLFNLWKGKLLVNGGVLCDVQMQTDVDNADSRAFLDKSLNVKSFLSFENFIKHIPPTLLNKSGKKHNVFYRGHCYNFFTLSSCDASGYGKFRQLTAYLVQHNAVAVVPLRIASCLFLLAKSNLTINKMGLTLPIGDDKANTSFLFVLTVTPKSLSSKINEKKIYNLIRVSVRKRKDNQTDGKMPEELDQKLRIMNIDSKAAVGSMRPEQLNKLTAVLKDKKRLQIADKQLQQHYKENEGWFCSEHAHKVFTETINSLWSSTHQARVDYYKPKPKKRRTKDPIAPMTQPITSMDTPAAKWTSLASEVSSPFLPSATEVDREITPIGDDNPEELQSSLWKAPSLSFRDQVHSSDQPDVFGSRAEKRRLSLEIEADSVGPTPKMSRPFFKAFEEIIFSGTVSELLLHPDFVFGERFFRTHRVFKEPGFGPEVDLDRKNQMSVQFRQQVPFLQSKDCPYACEGIPVVKSVLRGMFGVWEEQSCNSDKDKVEWIRDALHRKKRPSHDSRLTTSTKIDEKNSCVDTQPPPSGTLAAFASLLADALRKETSSSDSSATEKADVNLTPQDVAKLFTKVISDSGGGLPAELKNLMGELLSVSGKATSSSDNSPPPIDKRMGAKERNSTSRDQAALLPQDPRLSRPDRSSRRLPLPNYNFPPSEKAVELLPKDGEAARNLRPIEHLKNDNRERVSDPRRAKAKLSGTGTLAQKSDTTCTTMMTQRIPVMMTRPYSPVSLEQNGSPTQNKRNYSVTKVITDTGRGGMNQQVPHLFHNDGVTTTPRDATAASQATLPPFNMDALKNVNVKNLLDSISHIFGPAGLPTPTSQQDPNQLTRPAAGILRGTTGFGRSTKDSDIAAMSSSPKVLITADKRILFDSKDSSLGTVPSNETLSNKIPVLISKERLGSSKSSLKRVFTEDFSVTVLRAVPPAANPITSASVPPTDARSQAQEHIVRTTVSVPTASADNPDLTYTSARARQPITVVTNALGAFRPRKTSSAEVSKVSKIESGRQLKIVFPNEEETSFSEPSSVSPGHATMSLSESDIKRIREKRQLAKQRKRKSSKHAAMKHQVVVGEPAPSSASPNTTTSVIVSTVPTEMKTNILTPSETIPRSNSSQLNTSTSEIPSVSTDSNTISILSTPPPPPSSVSISETTTPALHSPLAEHEESLPLLEAGSAILSGDTMLTSVSLTETNNTSEVTGVTEVSSASVLDAVASTFEGTFSSETADVSVPISLCNPSSSNVTQSISPALHMSTPASTSVTGDSSAPNSHLVSEIDSLLASVRDVKQGKTSTEALSSRLLELALQLRGTPPEDVPSTVPLTSTILQSSIVTVLPSNDTMQSVVSTAALEGEPIQRNNVAAVSSAAVPMPVPAVSNTTSVAYETRCNSEYVVQTDVDASERDTHTPLEDDTYDPSHPTSVTPEPRSENHRADIAPTSAVITAMSFGNDRMHSKTVDVLSSDTHTADTQQVTSQSHPISALPPQGSIEGSDNKMADVERHETKPVSFDDTRSTGGKGKLQKIAHVKPQARIFRPSFYVFNPRSCTACEDIETFLLTKGNQFELEQISNALSDLSLRDTAQKTLVPVTEELLDKSLNVQSLWIVLRSSDLEYITALPYLALLKCAGPKVQFVQADCMEDVKARRYKNILSGEFGVLLPVSVDIIINNHASFIQLILWMAKICELHKKPAWRLAVCSNISVQLQYIRDNPYIDASAQRAANELSWWMTKHSEVIFSLPAKDDNVPTLSQSEVFDVATSFQQQNVQSIRHIVVLTDADQESDCWKAHRRAGIAVASVQHFIHTISDDQNKKSSGIQSSNNYSPIMKLYSVEIEKQFD